MEAYEAMKLEIVRFETVDVITDSDPLESERE